MKDPLRAKWLYFGAAAFAVMTVLSIATGGDLEAKIMAAASLVCFVVARIYSRD